MAIARRTALRVKPKFAQEYVRVKNRFVIHGVIACEGNKIKFDNSDVNIDEKSSGKNIRRIIIILVILTCALDAVVVSIVRCGRCRPYAIVKTTEM